MSKTKTTILIIAIILLIVGVIVCFCAATAMGFDFKKLATSKYITNEHKISDDFTKISVETNTADVIFALSEDGEGKVVCYEKEDLVHTVEVKNGTLVIKVKDERKWYQFININTASMSVTVHLPKERLDLIKAETDTGKIELHKGLYFDKAELDTDTGDITVLADIKALDAATDTGRIKINSVNIHNADIETNTGNVTMDEVKLSSLSISVDTGKVRLDNVNADVNIRIESDTGDIDLKNVIAADTMLIESDTGDVSLNLCDSADISIKTSTGDVSGTLLTPKMFSHKTSTGDVDLPPSRPGGECRIITSTGDMEIRIAE